MEIAAHPERIQEYLMKNGPMMVGLTVFEDFLSYEKGIYEYTTGEIVGGHAMKLIGWGTDVDGFLYWIL